LSKKYIKNIIKYYLLLTKNAACMQELKFY